MAKLLRVHARLRQVRVESQSLSGSVHQRKIGAPDDDKYPPNNKVVFRSWISKRWERRTGATGFTIADDAPEDYPILRLEIPDEQLAEEDLALLADDEADEDEEEGEDDNE